MQHKTLKAPRRKTIGEPDEGKPHVRFEAAGGGNQDSLSQAPPPDPTTGRGAWPDAPKIIRASEFELAWIDLDQFYALIQLG